MKTTDKNEKCINVLPFAVVQKAVEGDIVSINKVMKHYAGLVVYIISIMAAAIISILYSYFFYKKKLATGEGLKIQYNTKKCDISDHRNFRYCVYYMDFVLGKHSDSL